ncbi:MAG: SBBP repeat-containing protein, partial [Proteobacteria bacterium]|nr:SBBP repeat-containing protein [Pseudomonadota bacterium]
MAALLALAGCGYKSNSAAAGASGSAAGGGDPVAGSVSVGGNPAGTGAMSGTSAGVAGTPGGGGMGGTGMASGPWSKRFGGPGPDANNDLAVDAAGNVVLTGSFEGTVDFGGGILSSEGTRDIFVAKYDPAGNHLWSKRFGGSGGSASGVAIAADLTGNILLTGKFEKSVNFGGGRLLSGGGGDVFVAKLSAGGNHLWSKAFVSARASGWGIAADSVGNVLASGFFFGTLDLGGGRLTAAGFGQDVFVAKFGPDGTHLWSKRFGGTGNDGIRRLAIDLADNILLTGLFHHSIDFGGGYLASAGKNDIFVVKLDPGGAHLWSRRFGSALGDGGWGIAADSAGRVVLSGYFRGAVDFGGGALKSAGDADAFVAQFALDGTHLWSQRFGAAGADNAASIAVDGMGNILLTGYFNGVVALGGTTLASADDHDGFVAKFALDGTHLWSRR